jgi:hypothetical protein
VNVPLGLLPVKENRYVAWAGLIDLHNMHGIRIPAQGSGTINEKQHSSLHLAHKINYTQTLPFKSEILTATRE